MRVEIILAIIGLIGGCKDVGDGQPIPAGGSDAGTVPAVSTPMHVQVIGQPGSQGGDCEDSALVLDPVRFQALLAEGTGSCSDVGVDSVRVVLFRDGVLVRDETLPCEAGRLDLGATAAGDYEVAASGVSRSGRVYAIGLDRLRAVAYPDYPACDAGTRPCAPLAIHVEACGAGAAAADLLCDDVLSGGDDICGGA